MQGVKGTGRECGTFSGYCGGCHCDACKAANREAQQKYQRRYRENQAKQLRRLGGTPRPGSVCVFCKIPVITHPLRSCWREAARAG